MHIDPNHLSTVKTILQKQIPQYEVLAFGSRVHGQNLKEFSDLDLAIISDSEIPLAEINEIKQSFSESNLPIRIDIVDWSSISESFQNVISENYEIIQFAKK